MTAVLAEPTRAETWLYTQLSSDPTISGIVGTRIFADVAPQEVTDYPMIVLKYLSAQPDLYGNGPTVIWSRMTYIVVGLTEGRSAKALQTLADRIGTVLHTGRGGVTGAEVDYCVRRRPFRLTTVENNRTFQQLGYEFEIAVRAL